MRIETVFASGSRRALQWMALFGAVFALGAGSASAQTVEIPAGARVNIPVDSATTTPPVTPPVAPKSEVVVEATIEIAIETATGGDDQLDPDDDFDLDPDDLFDTSTGIEYRLTAVSSNPAVARVEVGTTITVIAISAGTATITITATVVVSSSLDINTRTTADSAIVEFDVTVAGDAPAFRLSGPTDMPLVEGGPAATVTATAERAVTADTTVQLFVPPGGAVTADSDDYRVEPIVIRAGQTTGTTRLTAVEDGEDEQPERLVLRGRVGDVISSNSLTFNIHDADEPQAVTPKSPAEVMAAVTAAIGDGQLNPDERFSLMAGDLFVSSGSITLSNAVSSNPAVAIASASGDTVTVIARSAGSAAITVTGTAGSSSTTVTFNVPVTAAEFEITLSGPEDTNLVEGGRTATVTATANRAVTADTEIELVLASGTASPADYRVEPIVIRAGGTTGTTVLTAVEDNQAEPAETLTLRGRASSGVTISPELTFTIYDAAVPVLPVIAQLLLAAFLAIGGYRRYLRRR